jgi:hypothetical protein
MVSAMIRSVGDQPDAGPSRVADQSLARTNAAISPAALDVAAGGSAFVLDDINFRQAIGRSGEFGRG